MLIALELLDKSEQQMLEKYRDILSPWMGDEIKKQLLDAIKIHLPDDKWRLTE